jgi:hypothetical protein
MQVKNESLKEILLKLKPNYSLKTNTINLLNFILSFSKDQNNIYSYTIFNKDTKRLTTNAFETFEDAFEALLEELRKLEVTW